MPEQTPDFEAGVAYWANTEASVDGVLGGYGECVMGTPVPRLDATSSRLLILSLLPSLSTIVPPHASTPATPPRPQRPFRALDCGAGIGRVTSTVLLPLFDLVDLVEPVPSFVKQAKRNALAGKEGWAALHPPAGATEPARDELTLKGARIWRAGLQHFDPLCPSRPVAGSSGVPSSSSKHVELFAHLGGSALPWPDPARELDLAEEGYDLVMVQWCVGHLDDPSLVEFLKRSRRALRTSRDGKVEGFIIVKENTCKDTDGAGAGRLFDDSDSSITRCCRSDKAFRDVFKQAGLKLLRREVQQGFPQGASSFHPSLAFDPPPTRADLLICVGRVGSRAELFPVVAYALQ
ncbi:SPOSA6832_01417 [Sporobolomyces salmonicolor]|uniref:Alpha N-terminal protein methyltransferase 1 n=1 Tax=Sporidiobolus salmonicolor TaxID=5005 RepID=A0A0D6EIP4_SPOSA|nr:SPOSA6832_01417 [Sporobolomyces salmonicolor]